MLNTHQKELLTNRIQRNQEAIKELTIKMKHNKKEGNIDIVKKYQAEIKRIRSEVAYIKKVL